MAAKRSLFSKPKWAAAGTLDSPTSDRQLFRHDIFEDILEADKLREENKAAKLKKQQEDKKRREEAEKAEHGQESIGEQSTDGHAVKKRRLTSEPTHVVDDEERHGLYNSGSELDNDLSGNAHDLQKGRNSEPKAVSSKETKDDGEGGQYSFELARTKTIDLVDSDDDENRGDEGDSDDNDNAIAASNHAADESTEPRITRSSGLPGLGHDSVSKLSPKPLDLDSESEEDEDFKELRRRAREHATNQKILSVDKSQHDISQIVLPPSVTTADQNSNAYATSVPPNDKSIDRLAEPQVEVLVKSIIPNTRDIIVRRLASQSFDKVRSYWCHHMGLPEALTDKIFFIWNCQRLYNSTTARSILEQIKRKHGTKSDGGDLSEGKITIEAVTEEIFQHRLKQREKERLENAGLPGDKHDKVVMNPHTDGDERAVQTQERSTGIVIRLVAPGTNPFNLRVRPDTSIAKIISGYKRKTGIDSAKEVFLVFDGERLNEEDTVADADFEDGDSLDVRIV